jgi:hypothetical protein
LELPLAQASLELERVSFCQSKHGDGPAVAVSAVSTEHGGLRVSVNWTEPLVTAAEGDLFCKVGCCRKGARGCAWCVITAHVAQVFVAAVELACSRDPASGSGGMTLAHVLQRL